METDAREMWPVQIKLKEGEECYLNVPEPQLGAVVRSTGDQVGVVGAPGQVRDAVRMTLQGPQQLQLVALLHGNTIESDMLRQKHRALVFQGQTFKQRATSLGPWKCTTEKAQKHSQLLFRNSKELTSSLSKRALDSNESLKGKKRLFPESEPT